jgi:hypothetical protein
MPVVYYKVQALREGKWVTIRSCKSYRRAVAATHLKPNRRLMVQTLVNDITCWHNDGNMTYQEWRNQPDEERNAKELARREQ